MYKFKPKDLSETSNHAKEEKVEYQHPFPRVIDHKKLGDSLHLGYIDYAKNVVNFFTKEVIPLLEKFSLHDDEHVNKYIHCCTSFEAIYNDIVAVPGGQMFLNYMQHQTEDFYSIFRSREYGRVRKDGDRLVFKSISHEYETQSERLEKLRKQWKEAPDEESRDKIQEKIDKANEILDMLGWERLPETPEDKGFKWRKFPHAAGNEVSKIVDGITYKDGCFSIDRALYEKWSLIEPTDRQRELYDVAAQICDLLKQHGYDQRLENLILWDHNGRAIPNMQGILGRTTTTGIMGEIHEDSIYHVV